MLSHNGTILEEGMPILKTSNRGFRYGDALSETMRALDGRLVFWEEHYLRLMSSMRILRMDIPMEFTMEFLESETHKLLVANKLDNITASIKLTVYREEGGGYLPTNPRVSRIIEAAPLRHPFYVLDETPYEIELFRDFHVNEGLLSTLKTNNSNIRISGSIYGSENGYANCLLLNSRKMVVGALDGNLFLVSGNRLKTPPLSDGCQNGIIRAKVMEMVRKLENYELEEGSVSPFELQKADELFITGSLFGIRPVTRYRKADYSNETARDLLGKLNALARLG